MIPTMLPGGSSGTNWVAANGGTGADPVSSANGAEAIALTNGDNSWQAAYNAAIARGDMDSAYAILSGLGPEYMEKALDYYTNQYQLNQAYRYDEYIRSTQYQRAVKDLEAAGLNPWLALQSGLGGGGSGSSLQAGTSSYSATNARMQKATNESTNQKTAATLIASLIATAGFIVAAML